MRYLHLAQVVLAGLALSAAVTACGGSSPKPSASGSPSSVAAGGSAQAQIKTNWEAFFNPKTPLAQREKLLQNGQMFSSVMKAQSGSSLASSVSAKVSKVSEVTATQAKVTYTILVAGTPELKNQSGVAVKQDGIWKVGDASFCALLALQNGGSTSSLPSACHGTG